jgi:hypothetical protein
MGQKTKIADKTKMLIRNVYRQSSNKSFSPYTLGFITLRSVVAIAEDDVLAIVVKQLRYRNRWMLTENFPKFTKARPKGYRAVKIPTRMPCSLAISRMTLAASALELIEKKPILPEEWAVLGGQGENHVLP